MATALPSTKLGVGSTALALLVATQAGAQSFALPDGVTFTGHAQLEFIRPSGGGSTETLGYLDFDMAYRGLGGDSGSLGFALGFTGLSDFDDSYTTFFAALLIGLGPGELAVGLPRLAFDTVLAFPRFAYSELLGVEVGLFGPGLLRSAALMDDFYFVGATYSARYGDLDVASSLVHDFDEEVTAFQVAASRDMMGTRIFGGAEYIRADGDNYFGAGIGAQSGFDQFSFGAMGFVRRVSGDTVWSLQGYGDYAVTQEFSVGAEILWVNEGGGGSDTLYGVRAGYEFTPGLMANLSYLRASGSSDHLLLGTIGYRW